MALILAIDTTAEFGSIALYDGAAGRTVEVGIHSPEGFGHILFDRISALLQREGQNISNIDCFAAACGPGSFTGVRVGLTAAKGLGEAAGRPVVAVSNLRALASFGTAATRAVVIDARRGEIYGAVYDADLNELQPERVTKFQVWLASVPREAEFIGVNIAPWLAALGGAPAVNASAVLAGAVARIAHREYAAGRACDPAVLDANYVRRSDAELLWTER
jgi:tRNA threonylcarbamoyladenosine biosynthesis protein TsaB